MSYVVFARKYRPQRFADMIGQEHIGRTLSNAIAADRVHHAYLFAGARGLGKTTTARIFAKGLVCEQGPTAEPCNACTQCVAVNDGTSVDVIEIDGASNNSVDNIRNLREQVHYLPQSARRKVYIIDEVHMLTTSAFNALLKTLEEPPPHVNFVFATTEPQKVLATILSRVNRLDFRRVSVEELVAHLQSILAREGLGMQPGGLRLVARAAAGSVRDSLTLLDQVVAFANDAKAIGEDEVLRLLGQADRFAIADLVDAIVQRDPALTLRRFDALVEAGHDLSVLGMQVLEHLRDLAIVKVCGTRDVMPDATDAEYARLAAQADATDRAVVGQLFDRFSRIMDRLQTSRAQRLLLEMGLLDLAASEPVLPVADLLARLDALASGGSTGGAPPAGGSTERSRSAAPARGRTAPARRAADDEPPAWLDAGPARETSPTRETSPQALAHDRVPAPDRAPLEPDSLLRDRSTIASSSSDLAGRDEPAGSNGRAQPHRVSTSATSSIDAADPAPLQSDLARSLWQMGMSHGVVDRDANDAPPADARANERPDPTTFRSAMHSPTAASSESAMTSPSTESNAAPSIRAPSSNGPCLPPPPADGVIAWEALAPIEAWEQLVARIREREEFLAAVLDQVGLVALADGILRVAAPRGSFAHNELSKHPQMRAQLEQAMRDHFGSPLALELVEGQPALPEPASLVLIAEQRRQRLREAIDADARADPRIRALLATFDATLETTRPLQDA